MDNHVSIFISHRHQDKQIADALRNNLELWGIPAERIFQSSNEYSGIQAGDEIRAHLIERLRKTDLLIMIFTAADYDWSYCTWELGVANGDGTKPTRVLCLCCTKDVPKLMDGVLISKVTHEEVKKLTFDLHKTPGFITSHPDTIETDKGLLKRLSEVSDQALETHALRLFEDLEKIVPDSEQKILHRWDYLKLHLEPSAVKSIRDIGDDFKNREEQFSLIKKLAVVHKDSQNSALRAFGYQDMSPGICLKDLKNRWVNAYREKKGLSINEESGINTEWARDLYADVHRAIFNWQAQRTFNYFESIFFREITYFRPAVIKAMSYIDGSMDFDVYLYRLEANEMDLIDSLIKSNKA